MSDNSSLENNNHEQKKETISEKTNVISLEACKLIIQKKKHEETLARLYALAKSLRW